jgi:hypothetical protein
MPLLLSDSLYGVSLFMKTNVWLPFLYTTTSVQFTSFCIYFFNIPINNFVLSMSWSFTWHFIRTFCHLHLARTSVFSYLLCMTFSFKLLGIMSRGVKKVCFSKCTQNLGRTFSREWTAWQTPCVDVRKLLNGSWNRAWRYALDSRNKRPSVREHYHEPSGPKNRDFLGVGYWIIICSSNTV